MADQSLATLRDTSSFYPDGSMGMTGRPITGVRVVLEWCARAILTPRGSLDYALDEGEDIREIINADLTKIQLEHRRMAYVRSMRRVDFVVDVSARLRIDETTRTARFDARVLIRSAGTFPLAVTALDAAAAIADFEVAA